MIRGSTVSREINLEEKRVHAPTPMIQEPFFSIPAAAAPTQDNVTATHVVSSPVETTNRNVPTHEVELQHPHMENVPDVETLRRSQRTRKPAIPDDFEIYVSEEVQMEGDPTTFEEATRSVHSSKWLEAMEDEMRSMSSNKVWDLEEIPKGAKIVGCKWVYKTKCDSRGNIERYKARLVAKGFTQREGIDYNETFCNIPGIGDNK
jgi:hypothetical protein